MNFSKETKQKINLLKNNYLKYKKKRKKKYGIFKFKTITQLSISIYEFSPS